MLFTKNVPAIPEPLPREIGGNNDATLLSNFNLPVGVLVVRNRTHSLKYP